MNERLKRIASNVLIGGASLLTAITIGELAVRTISPQTTMFPRYVESSDYRLDLPPNSRVVHSRGRLWKFVYTTNQLSRRGPYLPVLEDHDSKNVVVLGDSFTFGEGVRDDEVYTHVLAETLGPEFAVVNGGMGGWGIDSQIKWYYAVGRGYKPEFVVLQFTANDPSDYVGVTSVETGEFVFHPFESSKPWWQRYVSRSALIQKSHIYSLARSVLDQAIRARSSSAADSEVNPSRREAQQSSSSRREAQQSTYAEMLELFALRLDEAQAQLVFVSVTGKDRADSEYGYDVDRFPIIQRSVQGLEAADLLHRVDLPLTEMSGHSGSPEGHQWGPRHHEIVGTRVARLIRALAES